MEIGWYWYRVPGEREGGLYWVYEGEAHYLLLREGGGVEERSNRIEDMTGEWEGPLADPFLMEGA